MALQSIRDKRDSLIIPAVDERTPGCTSASASHAIKSAEKAVDMVNAKSTTSIRYARTSTFLTQNVGFRKRQDSQHVASEVLPNQQVTESVRSTVSTQGKLKAHPKLAAATKRKLNADSEQASKNKKQAKRERVARKNKDDHTSTTMTATAMHEAVINRATRRGEERSESGALVVDEHPQNKSPSAEDPYSLEDERVSSTDRDPYPSRNSSKTQAPLNIGHKPNLAVMTSAAALHGRDRKTNKLQEKPGLANVQPSHKVSNTTATLAFDTSSRKPAIIAWSPDGPANQGKSRLVAGKTCGPEDCKSTTDQEIDDMAFDKSANTPPALTSEGFKKPPIPKRLKHGLSHCTSLNVQADSSSCGGADQQNAMKGPDLQTHGITGAPLQQRPFEHVKRSRHKSTVEQIEHQTPSSAMAKESIVIDLSDTSSVASLSSSDDEDDCKVATDRSQADTESGRTRPGNASQGNTETQFNPTAEGWKGGSQLGLQDSVNFVGCDTGSQLSNRVGEMGSPYAAQTRLPLRRESAAAADSQAGLQPGKVTSFVAKLRAYGTSSKDQQLVADQGESLKRGKDQRSRPITEQNQHPHAKTAHAQGATSRQTDRETAENLKYIPFYVPKEQVRTSKTTRAASSSSSESDDDDKSSSSDLTFSSDSSTSLHQDETQRHPALSMHIHPIADTMAAIYDVSLR